MVPVLIAGLLAMVAAVVIGPKFIETLRARNLGQQIREEGPKSHVVKQGTPTMGGLLIVGSAVLPFLALSKYTAEALTVLFVTLGCAAIGFADDYLKLRRRHSLGLPGRWKMILLVAVTIGTAILLHRTASATSSRPRGTIRRGSCSHFFHVPCGSGTRMKRILPSPSMSSAVRPSTGSSSYG